MVLTGGKVKTSVRLPKNMRPRDFCREWFGVTEDDETQWGYRGRCVKLLAEITGLKVDTVERWGSGIDFPNMPPQYGNTLAYAITIKRIIEATGVESRNILNAVIEQIKDQSQEDTP